MYYHLQENHRGEGAINIWPILNLLFVRVESLGDAPAAEAALAAKASGAPKGEKKKADAGSAVISGIFVLPEYFFYQNICITNRN